MLKIRVLTAAILAPLFALGVVTLPGVYFTILVGLVALAGAWEWTGLSGYKNAKPRIAGAAAVFLLMAAAFQFREVAAEPLLAATSVAWLVVAGALYHGLISWPRPARWLSGAWVLVPAWLAISILQDTEPEAALLLFLLIWAADTGAYFVGKRWGRRKLAPVVSPGKTLEGLVGGTAATVPVAAAFAAHWGLGAASGAGLVLWSVFVVLVSIVGDLFESNWKRVVSLKDSSGLLPGHGGVLDRIDSMTAAAPFFALGWLWWFGSAST